jgi:hypothetical protein
MSLNCFLTRIGHLLFQLPYLLSNAGKVYKNNEVINNLIENSLRFRMVFPEFPEPEFQVRELGSVYE